MTECCPAIVGHRNIACIHERRGPLGGAKYNNIQNNMRALGRKYSHEQALNLKQSTK